MKKSEVDIVERTKNYNKNHCWQYDIRVNNLEQDIKESGVDPLQISKLTVSDFYYKNLTTEQDRKEATIFIERHEWLGKLSQYITHWFGAYYHDPHQGLMGKDILAGVIIMNVPNAFSKLLGENTKNIERLISRGACISWSPKNLASSFLMWAIGWMVKNTEYRLFTAYSDPTAKEIGTIYQACNFYYLGNEKGTKKVYVNPYTGKIVSDRFFRRRSAYKRYAKELAIVWDKTWSDSRGMNWDNIPETVKTELKSYSKLKLSQAISFDVPSKHKYAYVLGANKTETKILRKDFELHNKILPYPKRHYE